MAVDETDDLSLAHVSSSSFTRAFKSLSPTCASPAVWRRSSCVETRRQNCQAIAGFGLAGRRSRGRVPRRSSRRFHRGQLRLDGLLTSRPTTATVQCKVVTHIITVEMHVVSRLLCASVFLHAHNMEFKTRKTLNIYYIKTYTIYNKHIVIYLI